MGTQNPRVHCRQITVADIDRAVELLAKGFRNRSRGFWVRAFTRLTEHPTPAGFPKYGYLLEANGRPVGILLLLFSSVPLKDETVIRCNTSSWYVDPAFRSYASMLASQIKKHSNVTFFNITPAPHTLPMLEATGFEQYCSGRFIGIPALCASSREVRISLMEHDIRPGQDLTAAEVELLLAHQRYGCISIVCTAAGTRYPFVFTVNRRLGSISFAHLVYCRKLEDFVQFAGPLGRFLARHRLPAVVVGANGPIPGIIGAYKPGARKYFRGPHPPHLGDLAYSEQPMLGVAPDLSVLTNLLSGWAETLGPIFKTRSPQHSDGA